MVSLYPASALSTGGVRTPAINSSILSRAICHFGRRCSLFGDRALLTAGCDRGRIGGVSGAVFVPAFGHVQSPIQRRGGRVGGGGHADRDLQLKPVGEPGHGGQRRPKRAHGVNPWCPSGVSVNTCSRRRAPSGIRSLPAWAFPSSRPSSRTGGRPRPSSWSLPRCAFPSCCNGGGGSRLQPIAMKQHCSTQPSTSWTQPSMSSSSEMIPAAQLIEPPITHPRTWSIPTVLVRAPAI